MQNESSESTISHSNCDLNQLGLRRGTTTANPIHSKQARYWIATIPSKDWSIDQCPDTSAQYIRGQLERGESGYEHWQLVAYYTKKITLAKIKKYWPRTTHFEPTRSAAAEQYVWKEESRIGEVLVN